MGSHLADFLLDKKDAEIYGIERGESQTENIKHIKDRLKIVDCDIKDAVLVKRLVFEVKPDYIFHLAAQSFVPTSWDSPADTISTNILGELNIFEAVREAKINSRIQIPGSSEEYGAVKPEDIPIKEDVPLRPINPYGVSKVGQDLLGYQYFMNYGMYIVRTRGFNHSGPRRVEFFAESNFAKQIALIEKGLIKPVVHVGNLEARRDYTDVRDMVKGYYLALEKGEAGEVYNICSGKVYSIREILDVLINLSEAKVEIFYDPELMRPSDVPMLQGDNSKFREKTGWQPEIPIEKTLEDLLNYWRDKIR